MKKLGAAQFAAVNAEALELDERGYTVSRSVYAKTPRAHSATLATRLAEGW